MPAPHEFYREDDDDSPYGLPYGGVNLRIGSGEPLLSRPFLQARVFVTHALLVVALVSLALLLMALLSLALWGSGSEFETAVYTELVSGLAMFALLAMSISLSELRPRLTYASLFLLATGCGIAAWWHTGTASALLLEAAAGLLTILVLDIGYTTLVRRLSAAASRAAQEYAEFREQWDE